MPHADILTAFLNCGVAALAGSAVLRLAETDSPDLHVGLRTVSSSLFVLGLCLLPAALGPAVAHPLAQAAMAVGTQGAMVGIAHGFGRVAGRRPSLVLDGHLAAGLAVTSLLLLAYDRMLFGRELAVGLTVAAGAIAWQAQPFLLRPRNRLERAVGVVVALLLLMSLVRAGFSLAYVGPVRDDLTYVPPLMVFLLGAFYAVVPLAFATLLLALVNARLQQQLRSRASTDELTGALTRRALRDLAPALLHLEHLRGREVAVVMLDLDHFKAVNDDFGHAAGDRVLSVASRTLRRALRQDATLSRYGGEEFVALVPVEEAEAAGRVAERLRAAVEAAPWSAAGVNRVVTASAGVAVAGNGEDLDAALGRADAALYRAKRLGRNRVELALAVELQGVG